MGTLHQMFNRIEGGQRLLDAMQIALHAGDYASVTEYAGLLTTVLEGRSVPCCVLCDLALTEEEQDRFVSWCSEHAPSLTLHLVEEIRVEDGDTDRFGVSIGV